MALPERNDSLGQEQDREKAMNRIEQQRDVSRDDRRAPEQRIIEEQDGRQTRSSMSRVEEHRERVDENRKRDERRGHDFAADLHPLDYPRESLSRLEQGIRDDDEVRHELDHIGYIGVDAETRIDDTRNLSRTLVVLGCFLLVFAWVLLLWVGWDVRSGEVFFSTMCAVAIGIGLGLVAWGLVERRKIIRLRMNVRDAVRPEVRERRLREEGGRAA